jgi:hypothetical protein
MEKVPFFANTPDDTHCVQAAFKMILKYFMPERDFSFDELDKMSRKQVGKGTWWAGLLLELSKLDITVKDIEPFDYGRFYKEGESYVQILYPYEAANYHLNKTNLNAIKSLIPDFLDKIDLQSRPARLSDINKLLNDGWLIAAALNSRVLNDKPGFSGHIVVVYGIDSDSGEFWVHDPGPPPHKNWLVPREKFKTAFYSAGPKNAALVAVKKA